MVMEKKFGRGTEAEVFTSQTSATSDLFVVWLLSGLSLTALKENFVHCEIVLVAAYSLKFWGALLKVFSPSEYVVRMQ